VRTNVSLTASMPGGLPRASSPDGWRTTPEAENVSAVRVNATLGHGASNVTRAGRNVTPGALAAATYVGPSENRPA